MKVTYASHKALLLAATGGCLVGMVLVGFVFYPPHAVWDQGFRWGDAATWVAAIGTIGTVIVALGLASRDSLRRAEETYARGRVIASFLFTEIGLLDKSVEAAIEKITEAKTYPDNRANRCVYQGLDIVNRMVVSKIAANLDKLVDLPAGHSVALAAVPDMKIVLFKMMQMVADGSVHDVHTQCDLILPQLHTMKMRIDEFLAEYLPQFAT